MKRIQYWILKQCQIKHNEYADFRTTKFKIFSELRAEFCISILQPFKNYHAWCFSVCPGVKPPPSLKNIYKELVTDVEGFTTPDHGHLIGWSSQGVLLLNACLTVVASQANAHKVSVTECSFNLRNL